MSVWQFFLNSALERMWKKGFLPNFRSQPKKMYNHLLVGMSPIFLLIYCNPIKSRLHWMIFLLLMSMNLPQRTPDTPSFVFHIHFSFLLSFWRISLAHCIRQWHSEGEVQGVQRAPPPLKILKALQNHAKLNSIVKTVKNCWI